MQPLAEPALQAVRDGRTQILPEEWVKTYEHWLTNIQDWCISRQLWWGHQIPAFKCRACAHIEVSREPLPGACTQCGANDFEQDPDVLDTWFSSALWPFSTLGWPEDTLELRRFYPSDDLETGYDILFFWVARMLMMGLKFLGEVPFRRVLLHGMVVDETGDKMSKVKGNTIDPLDLIRGAEFTEVVQKTLPDAPPAEALAKFKKAYPSTAQMGKGFSAYGADALRFTLVSYSPQAKRIALSPARIDGYRRFCNKIYNAIRFALPYVQHVRLTGEPPAARLLVNRWILSRLQAAIEASNRSIAEFRLDEGSNALYHFFWDELCDWFLEMAKPIFQSAPEPEREETQNVLAHVMESALRALHPYLPFVTEELWQKLPRPESRPLSIALAPYPDAADGRHDAAAENSMLELQAVITKARAIRSEHDVHPGAQVPLELRSLSAERRALLSEQRRFIEVLVKTQGPVLISEARGPRPAGSVLSVTADVEVLVSLKGLIEPHKEAERVERVLKKIDKDLSVLRQRLQRPAFTENAPPEVVAEARDQLQQLERQRGQLLDAQKLIGEL